jgi:hypothetical protein
LAFERRDPAGEERDGEYAITLWHQKAHDGRAPHLNEFDFHRLRTDWAYRFLISTDDVVQAAVFITYGLPFARLLKLSDQAKTNLPLMPQLPRRYRDLFVEGCTEVLARPEPARYSGATVRHDGKMELYRAAFMPLRGSNSTRPLIFGSFNYRVVVHESASDALRAYNRLGERARREDRLAPD